jgi:branched-subunit amino acid ABC-type transport system permease component
LIDPSIFLISLFNGLLYASVLFLLSSGLNLIYGVMRIINIAHGNIFAFGAYACVWLLIFYGIGTLPAPAWYILPPLLGGVVAAAIAMVIEPTLLRPVYKRPEEFQLIMTFGVLLVLVDLMLMLFGPLPLAAREPYFAMGVVDFGGINYPVYNFLIISLGIAVAVFLWFLIYRTRFGIMLRATSLDQTMAQAMGVNVRRLMTTTFAIGAFIAGVAGAYLAIKDTATLTLGINTLVLAFIVIVIGGLGSMKGAFIGSLIVGYLRVVVTILYPEAELMLLWLVTAGILLARPQGLFGGR